MALDGFHLLSTLYLFRGSKEAARLENSQGNEPLIGSCLLMLLELWRKILYLRCDRGPECREMVAYLV